MNSATAAAIRKFKTADGAFMLAAGPGRRAAGDLARLSGDRGRGHARHRGEQPVDRVRQLQGRLSDRRAQRDDDPARSLYAQTAGWAEVFRIATATKAATFQGTIAATNFSGTHSGTSSGTNTGDQTITLTGNVTGSGTGSFAATIANSAVTYAKIQNVAASRLLGNPTGGATAASEISLAGGLAFSGTTLTAAGALTPTSVASTGAIKSSGIGGVGYATGAGASVTQLTSKSTAPPAINKDCGQIVTHNAALAAAALVSFTVSNSEVAATDTINLNLQSGNATAGAYRYWIDKVSGGSFVVALENRSGGSLSEALTFNFAVVKAVAA